jgi:homoserine kinase type II
MQFSDLYTAWPIVGPWQLTPMTGGTNSLVWRAEAADHACYILRIIPDGSARAKVYYETTLLRSIAAYHLPFALPLPIETRDGELFVPYEQENGQGAVAVLTPFLAGHPLNRAIDRNDMELTKVAARALAQLDQALAQLPLDMQEVESPTLQFFGQLDRVHPLVPDPGAAFEQLPVEHEQIEQLRLILALTEQQIPPLYHKLPLQYLHRDYGPSNILVEGQEVSAILDFEFAGRDMRALDLCIALSWWPFFLFDSGQEWPLIDAFANDYLALYPLHEEELQALPALFRMRDIASFIYRLGRYLAGREKPERIQNRVQHSLWRETWLKANEDTLLEHARSWQKANAV